MARDISMIREAVLTGAALALTFAAGRVRAAENDARFAGMKRSAAATRLVSNANGARLLVDGRPFLYRYH